MQQLFELEKRKQKVSLINKFFIEYEIYQILCLQKTDQETTRLLIQNCKYRKIKQRRSIYKQGQFNQYIYILLTGSLYVFKWGAQSYSHIKAKILIQEKNQKTAAKQIKLIENLQQRHGNLLQFIDNKIQIFGQTQVILKKQTSVTIITKQQCQFIIFDKSLFEKIFQNFVKKKTLCQNFFTNYYPSLIINKSEQEIYHAIKRFKIQELPYKHKIQSKNGKIYFLITGTCQMKTIIYNQFTGQRRIALISIITAGNFMFLQLAFNKKPQQNIYTCMSGNGGLLLSLSIKDFFKLPIEWIDKFQLMFDVHYKKLFEQKINKEKTKDSFKKPKILDFGSKKKQIAQITKKQIQETLGCRLQEFMIPKFKSIDAIQKIKKKKVLFPDPIFSELKEQLQLIRKTNKIIRLAENRKKRFKYDLMQSVQQQILRSKKNKIAKILKYQSDYYAAFSKTIKIPQVKQIQRHQSQYYQTNKFIPNLKCKSKNYQKKMPSISQDYSFLNNYSTTNKFKTICK